MGLLLRLTHFHRPNPELPPYPHGSMCTERRASKRNAGLVDHPRERSGWSFPDKSLLLSLVLMDIVNSESRQRKLMTGLSLLRSISNPYHHYMVIGKSIARPPFLIPDIHFIKVQRLAVLCSLGRSNLMIVQRKRYFEEVAVGGGDWSWCCYCILYFNLVVL